MTGLDGEAVMSHWKHFIIGPSKEQATRFYAYARAWRSS